MRFLLSNLMNPAKPTTFANLEARIPDVYRHDDVALENHPRPRFIKSHEYFIPLYPRVVYLVRDPRDVVISNYHWLQKSRLLDMEMTLDDYIPIFIAGEFEANGSWGDHIGSWLGAREHDHQRFLLVQYEKMLSETASELTRIASFVGLSFNQDAIDQAIVRSTADRMRTLEHAQSEEWSTTQGTRPDIPFVGPARAGGWQDILTPQAVTQIEGAWSHHMMRLGYLS